MSTLDKVTAALSKLGSDNKVAEALGNIVAVKRADSSEVLVAAIERKLTMAKEAGLGTSDGEELLKAASGLLSVAANTADVDYRVMSKAEFEDYAVGIITKAGSDGASEREISALRLGIDVASVLFAGSDVAKSFAIPVAKEDEGGDDAGDGDAAAEGDGGEAAADDAGDGDGGDAAAAADGDGDGDDAGDGDGDGGEAAAAGSEDGAEGDAAGDGDGDGDGDGGDDVAKSDDSALPWPADMNTKEFMSGDKEADPEESFQ